MADLAVPNWSKPFPQGVSADITVIKEGTIIESLNLCAGKPYFLFGRMGSCDSILEHPSISRKHAVIVYGNEDEGSDHDFFWIQDLGSTHGTVLNHKHIPSGSFHKLADGISFSFGTSTRTYVFEDKSCSEELDCEEYKQPTELLVVTPNKTTDETSVPSNPEQIHKMLKKYFEYNDLDFEPRFNGFDTKSLRYTYTLILNIEDVDDVNDTVVKGTGSTQEDALSNCELKAYEVLTKYNLLNPLFFETLLQRQERELVENDYYLSDEDTYFDRTGDIEQKRQRRMTKKESTLEDDFKSKNFCIKSKRKAETSAVHKSRLGDLKLELMRTKSLLSREKKRITEFDSSDFTAEDEADQMIKSSDRKSIQKQIMFYESKISATERSIRKEQSAIEKCLEKEMQMEKAKYSPEVKVEESQAKEKFPENYEDFYTDAPTQKDDFREDVVIIQEEPILKKKGPQFIPDACVLKKEVARKRTERDARNNEDEEEYWEPPKEQSGDGTTHLNEKFGY